MKDLNDRFVRPVKAPDGNRASFPDGKERGLALRVTPSGVKTWSIRYRRKADSKLIRLTIGEYPAFSLSEAREEAQKIKGDVARRKDPAAERRRGTEDLPRTFGQLAVRYLADHAAGKRSGFKDEQMLAKDVTPALDGKLLDEIKRGDVTLILDKIKKRSAPIQANRTFEVIRKVFAFAVEKGFVEQSPILLMKAPSKPRSRDRTLSPTEIRIFWRRIVGKTAMQWQTRTILRLCLITGQRVDEVSGARKSELHLDKAEWHLPGERVKNGSAHLVPLAPLALLLFKKAIKRGGESPFVFPSKMTRGGVKSHITPAAVARAMRRGRDIFGFDREATPHDLRRTLASGMAELGFPRIIQDKVLNHVSADRSTISGVYDRYGYATEKRKALEAWALHVARLLSVKP